MDRKSSLSLPKLLELSESDVYSAMKQFGAYLDITPGDFRELYTFACRQAQERLLNGVLAKDIMTTPPLLLKSGMNIMDAIAFLDGHNISGAPVTDMNERLIGLVSEKDIASALCGTGRFSLMGLLNSMLDQPLEQSLLLTPIDQFMTRDVLAIHPDTPLTRMLSLMHSKSINRLPVVTGDHIVGIVTRTDMLKALQIL